MKLIKADELYKRIAEQETWNVPDFVYDEIRNAPTVKAIPIEWIKKYLAEAPTHYVFVNDLLEDWEEENGK